MVAIQHWREFGLPASAIPGSKYLRGYCPACEEPIRVRRSDPAFTLCEECEDCFEMRPLPMLTLPGHLAARQTRRRLVDVA